MIKFRCALCQVNEVRRLSTADDDIRSSDGEFALLDNGLKYW